MVLSMDGPIRPAGVPPYTAYRYRTAPRAKIIHLLPAD
jgi:hypothetical protein